MLKSDISKIQNYHIQPNHGLHFYPTYITTTTHHDHISLYSSYLYKSKMESIHQPTEVKKRKKTTLTISTYDCLYHPLPIVVHTHPHDTKNLTTLFFILSFFFPFFFFFSSFFLLSFSYIVWFRIDFSPFVYCLVYNFLSSPMEF